MRMHKFSLADTIQEQLGIGNMYSGTHCLLSVGSKYSIGAFQMLLVYPCDVGNKLVWGKEVKVGDGMC